MCLEVNFILIWQKNNLFTLIKSYFVNETISIVWSSISISNSSSIEISSNNTL